MGAGDDAPARETAVAGGGDIEGRVADQQGGAGIGAEPAEDVGGEFGLRFQPGRVAGAEDTVEKRGEAEMVADPAGVVAALVGEDGEGAAGGAAFADEVEGAGEREDVFEEDRIRVGDMRADGGGDVFLGQEAAHGVFEAAADGGADLGEGGGGPAELRQGVDVAAVDGGEGIDEGAVEIEQECGEGGHAGGGT